MQTLLLPRRDREAVSEFLVVVVSQNCITISTNYVCFFFGSNVVKSYYKPLMELDEMVKKMVQESLGLQNYIDEFLDGILTC